MARQEEIIIEVEVNAGESSERLAAVQARIHDVKQANKELKAEQRTLNDELRKNGTITHEQALRLKEISAEMSKNNADLKELTAAEKMYTAQLNTATQNDRKFGDSLVELSAQLAQLKQEYRGLTAAQRESAEGKAMLKSIQELDKTLKDADGTLGDFQRNVGNYQSALLGLNGNVVKVANLFAGGFKNGIAAAGTALKGFAKTILATPVGWISAAIAAAVKIFNELRDAFKRNDDAGTALSVALARLQPIITAVREGFSALATVVAKVVGGITSAATAVLNLIPAYRKASEAAQELVKAQDALQDRQREYVVNEAERDKEIAELRKKAVSDEKMTAKEREEIYKRIDEISRQGMEERKNIAAENYRILQDEAKKNNDTSKAMKDKLAQAYAEMIKAQTDYLTETTRIGSRQRQAREEQAKAEAEEEKRQLEERKSRWQEWQRNKVEAEKKAQDELRKLEDLQNEMIEDEMEQRRARIKTAVDREIEDLNTRLETEKNLTTDARESIAQQIVLIRQKMWKDLSAVDDEELAKTQEQLAKMAEDTAKAAADAAKAAADAEAKEAERLRQVYNEKSEQLYNSMRERLNAVYGNAVEASEIELQAVQENYERLVNLDAETKAAMFGSEEQYKAAVLEAEAQILEARQKNADAIKAQATEVAQTMQAVTGALSDMFEAAAGDSEAYEKFKKAMAIADAAISLAQTIAAATSASTAGDPYSMAIRIAANVAAVTAQFAAVVKAIKAASIPAVPKFEEGGVVPGTSYTGDRVLIRANSGERVLTKEMSDNLVKMLAHGVPSWGIDYERMEQAFVRAASRMPAPVLDYSEFVAYGEKVRMEQKKLSEY